MKRNQRNCPHPRVLAAILEEYAWCVHQRLIEHSAAAWRSFVEGYVTAEAVFRRRRWRRSRSRDRLKRAFRAGAHAL